MGDERQGTNKIEPADPATFIQIRSNLAVLNKALHGMFDIQAFVIADRNCLPRTRYIMYVRLIHTDWTSANTVHE